MERFAVNGSVTLGTFAEQRRTGEAAIIAAEGAALTVDLAGLESTSSLAVALLTAWYRAADRSRCQLSFENLSAGLRQIIEFSGLAAVLPLQAPAVDPSRNEDPP